MQTSGTSVDRHLWTFGKGSKTHPTVIHSVSPCIRDTVHLGEEQNKCNEVLDIHKWDNVNRIFQIQKSSSSKSSNTLLERWNCPCRNPSQESWLAGCLGYHWSTINMICFLQTLVAITSWLWLWMSDEIYLLQLCTWRPSHSVEVPIEWARTSFRPQVMASARTVPEVRTGTSPRGLGWQSWKKILLEWWNSGLITRNSEHAKHCGSSHIILWSRVKQAININTPLLSGRLRDFEIWSHPSSTQKRSSPR